MKWQAILAFALLCIAFPEAVTCEDGVADQRDAEEAVTNESVTYISRVMCENYSSPIEIASVLKNDVQLSADDAAKILKNENFSRIEIGEAILAIYKMDARNGTIFLKNINFSAKETYVVLMQLFDIQNESEVERMLYLAGYNPSEFIDFAALGSVRKFAPILKFDTEYKGLPMSAQKYFQNMLTPSPNSETRQITWTTPWDGPSPCDGEKIKICGRDECNCGMENTNFSTLLNGEVPTYYQAISDIKTGRLRIAYWWFYGFNHHCNTAIFGKDGAHHGD